MYGRHAAADPTTVIPLEERGLLQILEPSSWIDKPMTEQLATLIIDMLTAGMFDNLPPTTYYHELSQSRVGYGADLELAAWLVAELEARGLARPSEDGVSIPLHPVVRTTILVLLGQLARQVGPQRGLSVHPTTNQRQAVEDLIRSLSRDRMPSAGRMVALDIEPVGLDLSGVPLDDVLQFRDAHAAAHRAYMRDILGFMAELSRVADVGDREQLLVARRQDLADAAADLVRGSRRSLMKNLAAWSLGIVGGVWAVAAGDPLGIALSGLGLGIEAIPEVPTEASAYSYLFDVQRSLSSS